MPFPLLTLQPALFRLPHKPPERNPLRPFTRTFDSFASPMRTTTPDASSDEDLLQRVADGDQRAFQQLYDRFAPPLFTLLKQMLEDDSDAQDVLQEGFLYLWDKASSYSPARAKAFNWAVMVFRHKAIDRLRSRGRRARMTDRAALELPELLSQNPARADEHAVVRERTAAVLKAVQSLPKEQRSLIECAFLKGLTHHAISESLGLPLGTVKTNIRRGLLRLRDLLKGGPP
jgi:RNA polymerase sigma-70 factor (ECF subfamily)